MPTLEYFVIKAHVSKGDSPQTWLAVRYALDCGCGMYDPTGVTSAAESFGQVGYCDFLAIFQAIGFGTPSS
jgi:hypothetical protein